MPKMTKYTIHERLKKIRDELNLNQKGFANTISEPSSTYGRYERGETKPDVGFLEKVAERHGISLDWLVLGEGPMKRGEVEQGAPPGGQSGDFYVNVDLFKKVVRAVEETLAELGIEHPDPIAKADFILMAYEYFRDTDKGVEKSFIKRHLRLVS